MRKAQLIARMMIAHDEWELLVNHVGSIRVGIGGVSGHWSVKNIVAHVMTREQHLADRLAEIARGETYQPCFTWEEFDAFLEEYRLGLAAYRAQNWPEALRRFRQAQTLQKGDYLTDLYLRRSQEFSDHPPAAGWDGVWTMTSKDGSTPEV